MLQTGWIDIIIPEKIAELKGNWRSQLISISSEGKENWTKEIWGVYPPIILDKIITMYEEIHELVGYQLNGEIIWTYPLGKCCLQAKGGFSYKGEFYLVISDWIESLYERGQQRYLN